MNKRVVYDCSTADCQCDACQIERGDAGPFNDAEDRDDSAPAPVATTPATTPADGELLPCPFCGAKAELKRKSGSWGYYPGAHWVECSGCGIRGKGFDDEDGYGRPLKYKEPAIAAWNARATPSPNQTKSALAAMVDAVRWWAKQEDGMPAEVAPAFNAAMLALGWSYSQQVDLDALATPSPGKAPEPVAWIPDDALAMLKPPLLVLDGVRLYRYNAVGTAPLYASPGKAEAEPADFLSLLADIRAAAGDNGERMQGELPALIKDLARDAGRYQWLRSDDIEVLPGQREICVYMERLPHTEDPDVLLTGPELDAAIDAALRASKEAA